MGRLQLLTPFRRLLVPSAAAGGLSSIVLMTDPASVGPGLCPVALLTGHACPGCGLTRAIAAMARGEWATMWALHPLAPGVALLAAIALAWWAARRAGLTDRMPGRATTAALASTAAALTLLWAVRMAAGTLPPV